MPEIKHNFLRGRMNKDNDERVVSNGEYRDAMNIQVSTSEDSDTGAMQNILGNKHVGVEFWSENLDVTSRCVGSIADEKNDKIYYFVANKGDEILKDNNLANSDNWIQNYATATEDMTETYTPGNGVVVATTPGTTVSYFAYFFQEVDLIHGRSYTVTVTLAEANEGGDDGTHLDNDEDGDGTPDDPNYNRMKIIMNGDTDKGGDLYYHPFSPAHATNGTHTMNFTFDKTRNYDLPHMRVGIRLTNGNNLAKSIRILFMSIMENNSSYILEYDTTKEISPKNNDITEHRVTPVFVDGNDRALKLNRSHNLTTNITNDPVGNYNSITGINIIDDMLFWTDGNSEPKKINIPRCIEGTNPDGNEHTNLINPTQGLVATLDDPYGTVNMEESHLTVIKKAPTMALFTLNETVRDKTKQYHADVRISQTLSGDHTFINSSKGRINDFRFLKVGDTFRTKLLAPVGQPEAISLEWKDGDEVVLKEYNSDGAAPKIPAVEYRIKGSVSNWSGNVFVTDSIVINQNLQLLRGVGGIPNGWNPLGFFTM